MDGGPLNDKARNAGRCILVLATVFALVVAPLVVVLTHGPGAHGGAAAMAADMTGEAGAHGPAHDAAGDDHQGGRLAGHNAADHEHQLHAVVCQAASAPKPLPDKARRASAEAFQHLTPEGPRRPPRPV